MQTPEPQAGAGALERRLLLAYLGAFAITFAVAALAVRLAFVTSLEQQTTTRLDVLAHAGLRSTLFGAADFAVDRKEISNSLLLERGQGLQWFDASRHLLASEGLTPSGALGPLDARQRILSGGLTFDTMAISIVNPRSGRAVGVVRASEWAEQARANLLYLDTGLLVGTLLAIIGSCISGYALARHAVRPVAQAFETLRAFTADASHELRGPLTVVAGSADAALRDDQRDPARDRMRFEVIADGAKQMSRLTSDLLLLAAADRSIERELFVVDLAEVVDNLTHRFQPSFARAGISLAATVERPSIIYGNPDQIERILANLIENALRYTSAGGSVTVVGSKDRALMQIAVRDSGVGIAPEDLDRIFDRFWRVNPARPPDGSGLGLAIARALARRHGGDVIVSSRLGSGSEFIASFPLRPTRVA